MLYTKLKNKEKHLREFIKLGVADPRWVRNLRIFELYHSLPKSTCVYCRYEIVAEEEGLSSDRVKHIVLKMSRD